MQIAALNAQGKSIEEISKAANINTADVEAFLINRGRTPETRDERVHRLAAEGMMQKDIAEKLGISRASVCKILKKESFRLEETEKEPASVGADTDSEVRNSPNISTSDSTTKRVESQALESARQKLLAIYETLTPEETRAWELGEVYAEIVRGIVWGCVE
jgi:DNA-binding CsgD family transcriptional regulator